MLENKKKLKSKIQAFTLQELVISMLISTSLLSMIFFSYQAIQTFYLSYAENSQKVLTIYRFINTFESDYADSHLQCKDSTSINLNVLNRKIEYSFNQTITRRDSVVIDTFTLMTDISSVNMAELKPVNQRSFYNNILTLKQRNNPELIFLIEAECIP